MRYERKDIKDMKKVILILSDGFRPDALTSCGNPYGRELLEKGSYSLEARTVCPSVTLPCHMSLFHSVPPQRHGILTNTYVPQVRPGISMSSLSSLPWLRPCPP